MQYNIVDYIHHAVYYIPTTYLFYNWKFVPLDSLHFTHRSKSSQSGIHEQAQGCLLMP